MAYKMDWKVQRYKITSLMAQMNILPYMTTLAIPILYMSHVYISHMYRLNWMNSSNMENLHKRRYFHSSSVEEMMSKHGWCLFGDVPQLSDDTLTSSSRLKWQSDEQVWGGERLGQALVSWVKPPRQHFCGDCLQVYLYLIWSTSTLTLSWPKHAKVFK